MSKRVAENSKSGIIGALWGFGVYTLTFLENNLHWHIQLIWQAEYLEPYVKGLILIVTGGGGLASYYRDRESPKLERTQTATQPEVVQTPVEVVPDIRPATKNWRLSDRSKRNLRGVNNRLVQVVQRALELSPYDFAITSGVRTETEQARLVKTGASKTMNSKHLTGRAVDIAAYDEQGAITWEHSYYNAIAGVFMRAADELDVEIEWGGDWSDFVDAVHFQLSDRDADIRLT